MFTDFKTWRRKLGLFTLAIACVFAVGWLRSLHTSDFVRFFPIDSGGVVILSEYGYLDLQAWSGRRHDAEFSQIELFGIHCNEEQSPRMQFGNKMAIMDPIESESFQKCSSWPIRYSYVVPPLTLLAAYFLLLKPKPSNSN